MGALFRALKRTHEQASILAPSTAGDEPSMQAPTWPSLGGVLVEQLLLHLPLLLLLLDLGLLVDLLDGLGALVGSPGHPVVLRGGGDGGRHRHHRDKGKGLTRSRGVRSGPLYTEALFIHGDTHQPQVYNVL